MLALTNLIGWIFHRISRLSSDAKLTPLLRRLIRIVRLNKFLGVVVRNSHSRIFTHWTHLIKQVEYKRWLAKNEPSDQVLRSQMQGSENFSTCPLISLIIPKLNADPRLLSECIDSVNRQTYSNWEVCLSHEAATGEFVALMNPHDLLWPNALYEVVKEINSHPVVDFVYSDEDRIDGRSTRRFDPWFKPGWSPEFLRTHNYIGDFAVIRKSLIDEVGGSRPVFEGAQNWDLYLRTTSVTDHVFRVPKVLYSARRTAASTAVSSASAESNVLEADAKARGLTLESLEEVVPSVVWHSRYKIETLPKVSIIIPTKDQHDYVESCLRSIATKTSYENVDLVIVETGSSDPRVWRLYEEVAKKLPVRVVNWEAQFNFSSVNNFGAQQAQGDYFLFLNNDTEVITDFWIEELLQFARMDHVGAVGAELLYPDETVQHAGIVLGVGRDPSATNVRTAHAFAHHRASPVQDWGQVQYAAGVRNVSAVTGACLMVSRTKFDAVGGFDSRFSINFNDTDLCLRLRKSGLFNVYNPFAKLYHHESASIGNLRAAHRNLGVYNDEIRLMGEIWGSGTNVDPFYNPNFRRDVANFRLPT